MANRSADWFRQAEADLEHAEASVRGGDYYIQTRYPNGFDSGAPTDYYTKRDAEDSIAHAKSILEFCKAEICRP